MENHIRLPKSAILELTYKCNHKCLFCSCPWYAPNSTYPIVKELDTKQWKQIIDKLYAAGVENFTITGGEATLYEGTREVVEHIRIEGKKRGLDKAIVQISNGRLLSDEWLQFFKKMNVHLCISMPGYRTFKELTGVDNVEGVLHWFNKAKELGVTTTANITVTKINYGELFQNISYALINGASTVLLNRFQPGGRGLTHMDELLLSQEQIKGLLDTAEEVLSYANKKGSLGTEIAGCTIEDESKYDHLKFSFRCAAASSFFVIDPAGQIRTCNHSPHIVGHALSEPMIQDVDYWNLFAKSEYKPQVCNECKLHKQCDGGCREVANILHGSPMAVDTSLGHPFKTIK